MGKYFGTDGIRGVANCELDCLLAWKTGLALATLLRREADSPLVYIGRDTRISGTMLEAALSAGLCAGGADVVTLGVLPTPGVAWLTAGSSAHAGIVISASHNAFGDNGIKIFGADGFKLTDEQERELERLVDMPPANLPGGADVGTIASYEGAPAAMYASYVTEAGQVAVEGIRVLIDCANGAASGTAKQIFSKLGVKATYMANIPDGTNINDQCGSTHMEELCRRVVDEGFDLGIAFDGDADRCLLCDEMGGLIDGDRIAAILAVDMKNRGLLTGGVVCTVVSNLGLHRWLKERGIEIAVTDVGDRHVLRGMLERGWNVGGEQSGHVILTDYCSTGDGQMTAAHFLAALTRLGGKASDVVAQIAYYPQVTINVSVPNAIKKSMVQRAAVQAVIAEINHALGESGRILIRPSGTEPKVRVMVEGQEEAAVRRWAEKAAGIIREEGARAEG